MVTYGHEVECRLVQARSGLELSTDAVLNRGSLQREPTFVGRPPLHKSASEIGARLTAKARAAGRAAARWVSRPAVLERGKIQAAARTLGLDCLDKPCC